MNRQRSWLRRKPESMLDWLLITCAAITFYMILNKGGFVLSTLEGVGSILAPFAGGVVIAYAINPIDSWLMKVIFRKNGRLHWLSMLLSYLFALIVVIGLIFLIVNFVNK